MRILSRLPERRGPAPRPIITAVQNRVGTTRATAREPREISAGLSPARGIVITLGIGALAWAVLLAITL